MSFRDRSRLFKLFGDCDSSSSGNTTGSSGAPGQKDSGFEDNIKNSNTSGDQKPTGRGRLLDELVSSASSLTLGKGRALIFKSLTPESSSSGSSVRTSVGRGNLFKQLAKLESSSSSSEDRQPTKEPYEQKIQKQEDGFFYPQNIQGNEGSVVQVCCNYIALECDENKGVFVYEVRFHPSVDSLDLRMKYLNEHKITLGNTKTFDGVTLYLPILLEYKLTTLISKSVADGSEIEIRIMYKRKESFKDCIHLYNVLFDKVMRVLNFVKFERKQFDPTAPKILPQAKLEIWPGYVTAVDEYEGGLMLNCDVSHRVLCQKTVLEMLGEIYQSDDKNFHYIAKKALIGSIVITRYNNRTYRIDDIDFTKSPKATFLIRDKQVSYLDYYKTNHNIDIKDANQPLIISIKSIRVNGKTEKEEMTFCLVPELCNLTGLTEAVRADFRLMREIATFTRVTPNQRMQALEQFYKNIMNSDEARQILQNWGLSLKSSCKTATGRQLREEQIIFAKKSFSAGPNADFSKYAVMNELLDVVSLRNWLLLHTTKNEREAKLFCEHMDRCTKALGMNNTPPKCIVLCNDRTDTFVNALRTNITKETQIVVCIQPTSRDDRYAAIKKLLCVDLAVPSQIINAKTLANDSKNRSICQKIALQMNCKLGGTLWKVKIPFKAVMICGIDSYHDVAQKENSVAAFVSSLNSDYTRWYSKAVLQTKREEIVGGLCSAFIAALHAYRKLNNTLPENVIVYRDGVGDGQLPVCSSFEIPQFERAVQTAFENTSIKITFIVVQKRINTKFFLQNGNVYNNPQPGTILDQTVTRRTMYDFFLVSQCVKQGSVTPSHYIVLRDDANYEPNIIQRLTYKLCFLYYNWPGTIRTPAPCQYAHKMAYLIGQSVRRAPADELIDKLFYL